MATAGTPKSFGPQAQPGIGRRPTLDEAAALSDEEAKDTDSPSLRQRKTQKARMREETAQKEARTRADLKKLLKEGPPRNDWTSYVALKTMVVVANLIDFFIALHFIQAGSPGLVAKLAGIIWTLLLVVAFWLFAGLKGSGTTFFQFRRVAGIVSRILYPCVTPIWAVLGFGTVRLSNRWSSIRIA